MLVHHALQQVRRPRTAAESGADGQRITAIQRRLLGPLTDRRRVAHRPRFGQRLRHRELHGGDAWGVDNRVSKSGAGGQRGAGREDHRAGHALVSTHNRHAATTPFVRVPGNRRQPSREVGGVRQMPRAVIAISLASQSDIKQHDASGVRTRQQQPALDRAKAQRGVRRRTAVGDLTGGRIETTGHVEGNHGGAAITRERHALAGGQHRLPQRMVMSGAEQPVHDQTFMAVGGAEHQRRRRERHRARGIG